MTEHSKIPDEQALKLKAKTIFCTILSSPQWIVKKVGQNCEIDFRVEATCEGQLRGCDFFVQVKGFSTPPDKISSHHNVRINCATANCWKEKLLPIMIVAINVDTARGHFVWFDKKLVISADQETITISVPMDKDELFNFKVVNSLWSFWEQWLEQVQDKRKIIFYRKLLLDTLDALQVLLNTYDTLLFLPENLLHQSEITEKMRDDAINACYIAITKWLHNTTLYICVGLGLNPIDHQIINMIARSQRVLYETIAPVSEFGGYNVSLGNSAKFVSQLPLFRRTFLEIIDFLSRQIVARRVYQ